MSIELKSLVLLKSEIYHTSNLFNFSENIFIILSIFMCQNENKYIHT